jgi:hypothetical protein
MKRGEMRADWIMESVFMNGLWSGFGGFFIVARRLLTKGEEDSILANTSLFSFGSKNPPNPLQSLALANNFFCYKTLTQAFYTIYQGYA